MSRPDFLETAGNALETYYPGYSCAFVAESMHRGEATCRSDIDIVVLFQNGFGDVHRYSVTENTWPIPSIQRIGCLLD